MTNYYFVKVLEFEDKTEATMTSYDIYENALIAYHEEMAESIGADGLKAVKVAILDGNLFTMLYNIWENGKGANTSTVPIPVY